MIAPNHSNMKENENSKSGQTVLGECEDSYHFEVTICDHKSSYKAKKLMSR